MIYSKVIKEFERRIEQKEKELLVIKARRKQEILELARQADKENLKRRRRRRKAS